MKTIFVNLTCGLCDLDIVHNNLNNFNIISFSSWNYLITNFVKRLIFDSILNIAPKIDEIWQICPTLVFICILFIFTGKPKPKTSKFEEKSVVRLRSGCLSGFLSDF